MRPCFNFYMDDSGARAPNHVPLVLDTSRPDYFALGGVIVADEDVESIKRLHAEFCTRWGITYPLHSVDIRHGRKKYGWLRADREKHDRFMADLEGFVLGLPIVALACVIDRPGYDARYREQYGRRQWHLCETAFSIAVERACKFAHRSGRRLRVYPEKSNPSDDARLTRYYRQLRANGPPFAAEGTARYLGLSAAQCEDILCEIDFKTKQNPLVQVADLALWPLVISGYKDYYPHRAMVAAGRVIDCVLPSDECSHAGVKYSCFELVRAARSGPETTKAQTSV
jgi:hypothetical protein